MDAALKKLHSEGLLGEAICYSLGHRSPSNLRNTEGRLQIERTRAVNSREIQRVKSKCKIISIRSQYTLIPLEHGSPTTESPGYTNIPKNHDADLKSYLIMIIESFK